MHDCNDNQVDGQGKHLKKSSLFAFHPTDSMKGNFRSPAVKDVKSCYTPEHYRVTVTIL
jgi:hypothetical protein